MCARMCDRMSVCECLHGGVSIPVCIQKLGEGTASLEAGVASILWDTQFVARVIVSALGVEEEDAKEHSVSLFYFVIQNT